jgi:hypothetical protein
MVRAIKLSENYTDVGHQADCQDAGPHPPRHAAKKDSMINEH